MFGNSFEETLDFCLFASQQIIFWSNPSLSLSLSLFYFFFNFFYSTFYILFTLHFTMATDSFTPFLFWCSFEDN